MPIWKFPVLYPNSYLKKALLELYICCHLFIAFERNFTCCKTQSLKNNYLKGSILLVPEIVLEAGCNVCHVQE